VDLGGRRVGLGGGFFVFLGCRVGSSSSGGSVGSGGCVGGREVYVGAGFSCSGTGVGVRAGFGVLVYVGATVLLGVAVTAAAVGGAVAGRVELGINVGVGDWMLRCTTGASVAPGSSSLVEVAVAVSRAVLPASSIAAWTVISPLAAMPRARSISGTTSCGTAAMRKLKKAR